MNHFTLEEIKEAMESGEAQVSEPKTLFISRKRPDRKAAAERYYWVDDILRDWHGKLNDESSNTREMPEDLLDLYSQVCSLMVAIRMRERELSE